MSRYRENDELAAMATRVIAALARRIATDDPDGLRLLAMLSDELDAALLTAINGHRASGFSDGQIARELGVSKQAVQKRFPRQPTVVGPPAPEEGASA